MLPSNTLLLTLTNPKISVLVFVLVQVHELLRLYIIKALEIDLMCRAGNGLAPASPPSSKGSAYFSN